MKPSEITAGKTYANKGKGRTKRTVIAIGDENRPERFYSDRPAPNEPGVLYEEGDGKQCKLYISSFASWRGKEAN